MTFFYMDTDAGSDANNGTTWALAKLTFEGVLAVMSAGDTCFIQGAADDTAGVTRTFSIPGTPINPCHAIGVVDGTTNEGINIVASDLAATLPKIATSAGNIATTGSMIYKNLHLSSASRFDSFASANHITTIVNGKVTWGERMTVSGGALLNLINAILEINATFAQLITSFYSKVNMIGGSLLVTVTPNGLIRGGATGFMEFTSVDMSGLGTAPIVNNTNTGTSVLIRNCKLPAALTLYGVTNPIPTAKIEVISSSDTTSQGATSSIQDYQYEDIHGTIDSELTAVRTGGADDGARGAFAYAMTPKADATLEGSNATLKSPWMSVWLAGGANTLTVYIANDGAVDYNEDEAWVEFYTPDAGDTAQHDQTFDPADERLLDSTTTITDDAVSVWGGTAANGQKFSATVTTGFEGFAYARLHVAKRQATPDTVFLDPVIVVT